MSKVHKEDVVKKTVSFLLLVVLVFALSACGLRKVDTSDLPALEVAVNEELGRVEITYNGIVYRPFGACDKALIGDAIGLRSDTDTGIVYTVKGYDADEWIIDMLTTGLMDNPALWKAVGLTDIPEGLKQYDAEYGF